MENFSCVLCNDLLQRPVSLPCGHMMCLTCLCKLQSFNFTSAPGITCPLCRKICNMSMSSFGVVIPVATLIKDLFHEKQKEREMEETRTMAELCLYKKYAKTRFIRISNIVRNMLRYRPICSYQELKEVVSKKADIGTSMSLVELKHVLSLSNVHMFQEFCICPALFFSQHQTVVGRSDMFRYAVREYIADCKKKNIPVTVSPGDPLPYNAFIQKCVAEVEMAISIIEGWGEDARYMQEWMKHMGVADESYFQSLEYVLPELLQQEKLDPSPIMTDKDIINTVTSTYEKLYKLKTNPVDWSDWEGDEDGGDICMKRETFFSIDYTDIQDTTWLYPSISRGEFLIAKYRSPTIRAKMERAIKESSE